MEKGEGRGREKEIMERCGEPTCMMRWEKRAEMILRRTEKTVKKKGERNGGGWEYSDQEREKKRKRNARFERGRQRKGEGKT